MTATRREELIWGVNVALGWNALVIVFVRQFDPSLAAWLVTLAAANEVYGVLLIASPELLPHLERVRVIVRDRSLRGYRWVRRILGRPVVRPVGKSLTMPFIGSSTKVFSPRLEPANVGVEAMVTWLAEQNRALHAELDTLRQEVRQHEARWRADIAETAAELHGDLDQMRYSIRSDRLPLRLLGLGFVLAGLGLALWGNLEAL